MKILTAYLSRFAGICFRKLTHLFQKDRYSSIAKCSARAYFFVQWDIPDRSVAFWGYQLAPHFWITEMRDLTKLLKSTPSISWTKIVLVKASCRVQYIWYSGFHTIPMIRQTPKHNHILSLSVFFQRWMTLRCWQLLVPERQDHSQQFLQTCLWNSQYFTQIHLKGMFWEMLIDLLHQHG